MMAVTHAAVGALGYAGLASLGGEPITGATLGAAALGSLLPDVDTPTSRAGFCVYPLALWLEKKFGHRTLTHSLLGWGLCACFFSFLLFLPWGRPLFPALVCGFGLHLLGDAATKSGVPLLWPRRERWVFPGDAKFRLSTGSPAEFVVLGVVLLIGALTLPVAQMGPRRWLHLVRGDIGSAVHDQQNFAHRYATEAEVEGYDVLTHKLITGRFPVAGLQGDSGLLVERGGALWMVSKRATAADPFRIEPRRVRIYAVRPLETRQETRLASNIALLAIARRLALAAPAAQRPAPSSAALAPRGNDEDAIRVSGVAHCFAFRKGAAAPHDQPPKPGIKRVEFKGSELLTLRDASLRDLRACGGVVIRSGSLALTLPKTAPAPGLLFEGRTRTVEVPHLARHPDLTVEVGQLVGESLALGRPFAQTLAHKPTPDEQLRDAQAKAAHKALGSLSTEENALRGSVLWPGLRGAFAQRRATLARQAAYKLPGPTKGALPPPVRAPFCAVVESVEWAPPTVPVLPGEKPEDTARVTLVEVAIR